MACGGHLGRRGRGRGAAKGGPRAPDRRLRTRSWEKDGERRYKTEVVCNASDVIVAWLPGQAEVPAEASPEAEGDADPA